VRFELFAENRLGDAVARLYARHAELLPAGPARDRATTTARSVAALLDWPADLARLAPALDPAIEVVDHRPLGLPPRRGAQQHLEGLRSVFEVSTDVRGRVDDILCLQANGLLVRRTQFGTARAGGGAYERSFLLLSLLGPDGLVTRQELFAVDADAE